MRIKCRICQKVKVMATNKCPECEDPKPKQRKVFIIKMIPLLLRKDSKTTILCEHFWKKKFEHKYVKKFEHVDLFTNPCKKNESFVLKLRKKPETKEDEEDNLLILQMSMLYSDLKTGIIESADGESEPVDIDKDFCADVLKQLEQM